MTLSWTHCSLCDFVGATTPDLEQHVIKSHLHLIARPDPLGPEIPGKKRAVLVRVSLISEVCA